MTENAYAGTASEYFKLTGIGTETIPGNAVGVPGNWGL